MSISKDLVDVIKASGEKGTRPYDTQATVTRVEGSTVWVHIPGGVDETPVKKTISARKGDEVQVRISGGSAYLLGNASNPPTDDAEALKAREQAIEAQLLALTSKRAAKEAEEAAQDAKGSAVAANQAASGALAQLSVVEDVVGTLAWISEHGTYEASSDTEVVPGKHYFTRDGEKYDLIVSPTGDPSQQGYYELTGVSEAVTNFISTHLALTNEGLWVTNDEHSYKVLLASDGMKVYDAEGNLMATFGESISFSSTRPQYIGGEDAFIIFYDSDGDGTPDAINIGGSNVTILGDKKLSDLLTSLDISARQTESGAEITVGDKTVTLKDGADAAVLRIDSSRGTLFKNSQVSTVLTVAVYIGGARITNINDLKSEFGSTARLQWYWQRIGEDGFGIIVDSDPKLSDNGFSLTLTPEEVDTKVTFMCELIV